MIGWLSGEVVVTEEDRMIVNVGGVGYAVHVPLRYHGRYPSGSKATWWIEPVFREDNQWLYGFETREERDWFRVLTVRVTGVGAKLAMAVLGVLTPPQLTQSIGHQTTDFLLMVPGVGRKLAERILHELRHVALPLSPLEVASAAMPSLGGSEVLTGWTGSMPPALADGVEALVQLGYARVQVHRMVQRVREETEASVVDGWDASAWIRQGLAYLSKSGQGGG